MYHITKKQSHSDHKGVSPRKKGYIPRPKNAGCKNQTQTIWQEPMTL